MSVSSILWLYYFVSVFHYLRIYFATILVPITRQALNQDQISYREHFYHHSWSKCDPLDFIDDSERILLVNQHSSWFRSLLNLHAGCILWCHYDIGYYFGEIKTIG